MSSSPNIFAISTQAPTVNNLTESWSSFASCRNSGTISFFIMLISEKEVNFRSRKLDRTFRLFKNGGGKLAQLPTGRAAHHGRVVFTEG